MIQSIEKRLTLMLSACVIFIFVTAAVVVMVTSLLEDREKEEITSLQFQRILHNLIEAQFEQLQLITDDYAFWDDTYSYIAVPNPHFLAANFSDNSMRNALLSAIYLQDKSGEFKFASGIAAGGSNFQIENLLRSISPSRTDFGVLVTGGKSYLYASQLVKDSEQLKETNGKLTLIRRVEPELSKQIGRALGIDVRSIVTVPPYVTARYSLLDGFSLKTTHIQREQEFTRALINGAIANGTMIPVDVTLIMPKLRSQLINPLFLLLPMLVAVGVIALVTLKVMRNHITQPVRLLSKALVEMESPDQLGEKELGQFRELGALVVKFRRLYTQLQEQKQQFEDVFNTIQEVVVMLGSEGQIVFANASALGWFQTPTEELLGQKLDYLLTNLSDNSPSVSNWIYQMLEQNKPLDVCCSLRMTMRPDQTFVVWAVGYPARAQHIDPTAKIVDAGLDSPSGSHAQRGAVVVLRIE